MIHRLRFAKRLVRELPGQLRLAYCLMFDPRVPARTKLAFSGAMVAIMTPVIDLPALIPFIGELDVLALTLLALRLFIAASPHEAVVEQQQLIIEQRSRFDDDVRNGESLGRGLAGRFRQVIDKQR
ncbi:MAG: hypothetical protein ABR564_07235, partial [Candidatus Dormibacteria bacterium]